MEDQIKKDVYEHIDTYKNGTDGEKKIGENIENFAKTIKCFRCLDTTQIWYYRGLKYKYDGKGEYCKFTCPTCSPESSKNKWIEDTKTSDLYGKRNIKIFNRENFSGMERFTELEKYVVINNPVESEPDFKNSNINSIKIKKTTKKLDVEVSNIINKCSDVLKGYYGDITSINNILNDLQLNISIISENSNKINEIYNQIEDNKFLFINIKNESSVRSSGIACICKYDKYDLDIDISIQSVETLNRSAKIMYKDIINKKAINNTKKYLL